MNDFTVQISDAGVLALKKECETFSARGGAQYGSPELFVQYLIDLEMKKLITTYNTDTVAIDEQITALQAQKVAVQAAAAVLVKP